MKVSSFTFCHNSLLGGYPLAEAIYAVRPFVDEVVGVDMASTDDTRKIMERLCDVVLDSPWDTEGKPMDAAFKLHTHCSGDVILLHEADEVFDPELAKAVVGLAKAGNTDLRVWRLQITQGFQRCQWYPHPVHRLFPKGMGSYLDNPVIAPDNIPIVSTEHGFLWDVSGCFRDNYWQRKKAHSEVWGKPRNIFVREHFLMSPEISDEECTRILNESHWEWGNTPFAIPVILKPLVGKTKYEPTI